MAPEYEGGWAEFEESETELSERVCEFLAQNVSFRTIDGGGLKFSVNGEEFIDVTLDLSQVTGGQIAEARESLELYLIHPHPGRMSLREMRRGARKKGNPEAGLLKVGGWRSVPRGGKSAGRCVMRLGVLSFRETKLNQG